MSGHKVVSQQEWLKARQALLAEEKAFTRERDRMSAAIRALPWAKVEKEYVFEGSEGRETLAELFAGKSQLIVHHFMFDESCKSCSFWADNYDGIAVHLAHRDVAMVTVSQAPLAQLLAYKQRMGWGFKWVSSHGSEFNRDFHVSFTEAEIDAGKAYYNYRPGGFPSREAPGFSVFCEGEKGQVFHTYSTYGRGQDILNGAYHYLDIVPKGRDEAALSYTMEWLKHHDSYED